MITAIVFLFTAIVSALLGWVFRGFLAETENSRILKAKHKDWNDYTDKIRVLSEDKARLLSQIYNLKLMVRRKEFENKLLTENKNISELERKTRIESYINKAFQESGRAN